MPYLSFAVFYSQPSTAKKLLDSNVELDAQFTGIEVIANKESTEAQNLPQSDALEVAPKSTSIERKFNALMLAGFLGRTDMIDLLLQRKLMNALKPFLLSKPENMKEIKKSQEIIAYIAEMCCEQKPIFDENSNIFLLLWRMKKMRGMPNAFLDQGGYLKIRVSAICEFISRYIEANRTPKKINYSDLEIKFWSKFSQQPLPSSAIPDFLQDPTLRAERETTSKKYRSLTRLGAITRSMTQYSDFSKVYLDDLTEGKKILDEIKKYLEESGAFLDSLPCKKTLSGEEIAHEKHKNKVFFVKTNLYTLSLAKYVINREQYYNETTMLYIENVKKQQGILKLINTDVETAASRMSEVENDKPLMSSIEMLKKESEDYSKDLWQIKDIRLALKNFLKRADKIIRIAEKEDEKERAKRKLEGKKELHRQKEAKRLEMLSSQLAEKERAEKEAHAARLQKIREHKKEKRDSMLSPCSAPADTGTVNKIEKLRKEAHHTRISNPSFLKQFVSRGESLTLQDKIALPQREYLNEELSVLEDVLSEIQENQIKWEQISSEKVKPDISIPLGKLLKYRNAMLGVFARAMEITMQFKPGYQAISPAVAESIRDVLFHTQNFFPEIGSKIEIHQEFYEHVIEMVAASLNYIKSVQRSDSNAMQRKYGNEMISHPLFIQLLKEKDLLPDRDAKIELETCLAQWHLADKEQGLYEQGADADESSLILAHAEGFSSGRKGAFAKLIRRDHKEEFDAHSELYNEAIRNGAAYRHAKQNPRKLDAVWSYRKFS